MSPDKECIALIGGTGDMGTGLARRWAGAGHGIILGSRDAARAQATAAELCAFAGEDCARGMDNEAAARACGIAVLTVPYAHHDGTLKGLAGALAGKIMVDTTAPLIPPKLGKVQLPEGGSAALIAQEILGPDVTVVSAFQNVSAAHLISGEELTHHVLVCGNKRAARDKVTELAAAAGLTAWHGGPLANSAAAEALTSVLISINRHHGIDGAGIMITGEPNAD